MYLFYINPVADVDHTDLNIDLKSLKFLKKREIPKVLKISETLLGVPEIELGKKYVVEFDRIVFLLDDYLHKDVHTLIWLFNSRLMTMLYGLTFKSFKKMSMDKRVNYTKKWVESKIPLFRTSMKVLVATTSWAFYSQDEFARETGFLGPTVGNEHITPTLLFGKEPYNPAEYLEEETK